MDMNISCLTDVTADVTTMAKIQNAGSTKTTTSLNSSVQQIINSVDGRVLIETAPDNNLKSNGIERGDGIMIATDQIKPHTGGGMYLLQFPDGYKSLWRIMLIGTGEFSITTDHHRELSNLNDVKVVGRIIGVIGIRKI